MCWEWLCTLLSSKPSSKPELMPARSQDAVSAVEGMHASWWISTQQCIPCGMKGGDGQHGAEVLVHEGVQQPPTFVEHLHPPRSLHTSHYEAVLLFGVPHCWQIRQPPSRLHVMADGFKKRSFSIEWRCVKYPYVVIQTWGENSVSCARREISTGSGTRMSIQMRHRLACGLLQVSAVINTYSPAYCCHKVLHVERVDV